MNYKINKALRTVIHCDLNFSHDVSWEKTKATRQDVKRALFGSMESVIIQTRDLKEFLISFHGFTNTRRFRLDEIRPNKVVRVATGSFSQIMSMIPLRGADYYFQVSGKIVPWYERKDTSNKEGIRSKLSDMVDFFKPHFTTKLQNKALIYFNTIQKSLGVYESKKELEEAMSELKHLNNKIMTIGVGEDVTDAFRWFLKHQTGEFPYPFGLWDNIDNALRNIRDEMGFAKLRIEWMKFLVKRYS